MKIRYILLLIITVLGVSSCYDDKGNYSYDPKNDIKITFDASYFEAILGEKIKLTPRLTFAIDSNDVDLSYKWTFLGKEISDQRNLEWVVDTVTSNHNVYLNVTDNRTGVTFSGGISAMLSSAYAKEAWVVLAKQNGKSVLSYIRETQEDDGSEYGKFTYTDIPDIYQLVNGEELGTEPVRVLEHFAARGGIGHFWVLQNGGQGCVDLSGEDFTKDILLNDIFLDGNLPVDFKPIDMIDMKWLTCVVNHDGKVYTRKKLTNQLYNSGYFIDRPMGFLYTPDLSKAPQLPEIKKSQLFADFGWATMRTSWEKDATMLAVKSGHTWNHSHADANSFIIFHKGVDIIKDAGNCWYPNPSYRNYFFQSEAHNVVLFNGKGQSREQQYHGSMLRGYLHYLLDADNVKYVLANGTGPYSDQFSRNFRHFLWIDDVIYMIDDLKTHDVGHFEWLWHPGGEAEKRGIDLNITNGNSSVVVRPLYPRLLAKSDFVHDYPEDLYWEEVEAPTEDLKGTETYYSFHLPAKVDRVKGLTAIILKETPDQKDLPYMERREGKDWIGLRIHYKGKITDLYINQLADGRLMHSNSWIEADGWFTDAYMFAVTYEVGMEPADSKERFICYGSALRRGDVSFFSSLAKLFVIQKEENGRMKLWMDGQPKMNARFRSEKRPKAVVVNGKVTPVVYEKGTVKVSGVVIE